MATRPDAPRAPFELAFFYSVIKHARDTNPRRVDTTWGDFLCTLSQPEIRGELWLDGYLSAPKSSQRDQKDGPGFVPALFKPGGRRVDADVDWMTACSLDFDDGQVGRELIQAKLDGLTFAAYTSYSHSAASPRWRVVIPFALPIQPGQAGAVFQHCNLLFDNHCDSACRNPSHFFYLPACPPGGETQYQTFNGWGRLFDPTTLRFAEPLDQLAGPAPNHIGIDDLGVGHDIMELIRRGAPGGTRSEAIARVVWALLTAGHAAEAILSVLMNPSFGISDKPRQRGERWTEQEIERLQEKWRTAKTANESSRSAKPENPDPGKTPDWGEVRKKLYRLACSMVRRGNRENEIRTVLLALANESGYAPSVELESKILKIIAAAKRFVDEQIAEEAQQSKPLISLDGGELIVILDQSEAALLARPDCPIYQRSGQLVRLVQSTSRESTQSVARAVGSLITAVCEPPYLVEEFMRGADYQKWDARRNGYRPVDLPERYATHYLARRSWKVPELVGTIEAPTLRADGSILDQPGYDAETGLYFESAHFLFPPIPDQPSLQEARLALELLKQLLQGFSFEQDFDLSVAIGAILTALVRRSLETAPMLAFNAPKMGSGKSLLADAVALIATGHRVTAVTHTDDPNEERKRLISVLIEGDPVVCIDNIEKPFESEALCCILTLPFFKDRQLGKNKMVSAPTCATFLATGNNLQVIGDLTRRVLPCTLDPQCERPYERTFDVHLPSYVLAHRGELVQAALTILRAYHVAGRPNQKLVPFGSFESWSDSVRSALVWCGMADPCLGLSRWEQTDTVRTNLAQVLEAWHAVFASAPVTVAEVVARAEASEVLKDVLLEVAAARDGHSINTRSLGRWLMRYIKRIEGGYRLELAEGSGSRNRYRVVKAMVSAVFAEAGNTPGENVTA